MLMVVTTDNAARQITISRVLDNIEAKKDKIEERPCLNYWILLLFMFPSEHEFQFLMTRIDDNDAT